MSPLLIFSSLLILSYLIGSISSAILTCKALRLPDPRTQGSHNPGATNVLRFGGKKAAALTLFGDAMKGWLGVFIAAHCGLPQELLGWIALAAVIGHMYPIFFKFQGGKGVATFLGALIALSWITAFAWVMTWLTIAFILRYSSLAALVATALSIIYIILLGHIISDGLPITIITLFVVWRHRENIKKLWQGTERRIGEKK